ncbi:unnamed protein product [Closterium sp. NIES-64]|nr:unnamed protein product [Closterium sp. NIES-64]
MRSRAAGSAELQLLPSRRVAELLCCRAARTALVLTFDAEGRAIDFDVWVDDLQLFLQCDRADGLSLFDLTSGASRAPAADADATVRSQWATRDAAARLAVRRHLPTTERAHFSQYKSAQTLGVPPPPFCPLSPLLLRPTSLVLSRSVRRLPLAGDAALARARGARAVEELAGVVEAAVEAAEGVGVAVGVVAGVEVLVAAVEAEAAEAVPVGAEAAVVAEVEEAVVEEVELVGVALRGGSGGGQSQQQQQQQRSRDIPPPQQLREWYAARQHCGGTGPCTYVLRTSDRAGEQCEGAHPTQRCFGRMTDAWRHQFPEATEIPRWGELSRAGVAIFDLDFDAILAAMYGVTNSDKGDCYRCFPPDPGIETAALCTGEAAALGASEAAALGASASASSGAGESALSSTALPGISLRGPVLSHFSTVLPCPAAPSGTLSGLYLPSFSTNLVSGADLQDAGVRQFTPASQRVTHCSDARTGRHVATFTRRPGSSLYTLTTESPPIPASGQVAASGQVFAAASRSGPESAPCSCRPLSHETVLWHHRLGHPSLPRLRGMASRVLLSGLPRSLHPLSLRPGPSCVPCVEGRLRASPHSSQFPPTGAPLQTLHMDVWGPARVRGQGHERYFLLVVDDYSRYTTTFTLLESPQQNGIAERRIDMVMDVARTSMMHAAAPHFLWSFAVRYAAHQINLHPRVSMPKTSPALLWTGKVGDASAFRVWGSRAFVRDLSADKLSPRAAPCVFLGFPPDAPGWQFYHPTSRRVLSSQDVTFDESVPYYRLFPYRTPSLPPPPLFLVPGPPPVDPCERLELG